MTDVAQINVTAEPGTPVIHPLYVRITHWINALAMLVMIGSGWQIYNASPLFDFRFPAWSLGGWLAGGIAWHFAAMWVLVVNGLVYVTLAFATGRFRRKLLPIRPAEVARDLGAALTGRLRHDDIGSYNAVQKLLYAGVLGLIVLVIASGLAIWKPVQLQWLTALFGGFQGARIVHFLAMSGIAGFILVHVTMALIVPRTILAMLRGR